MYENCNSRAHVQLMYGFYLCSFPDKGLVATSLPSTSVLSTFYIAAQYGGCRYNTFKERVILLFKKLF